MIKLFNVYGLDKKNPYINTFSDYHMMNYIDFIDEINFDKPLIIVGIENIEKFYTIDYDNQFLDKNVLWCYSPEEYLNEFLKQFRKILDSILEIIMSSIEYINYSVFEIESFNNLLKLIDDSTVVYQRNKMVYCFKNKTIKIINLMEFYYFGLFDNAGFEQIKDSNFYNDSDSKIFNFYQNIFNKDDDFFIEKTIPYFISLDKNN